MTLKIITEAELESLIADELFMVEGTATICVLELHSGFKTVGMSNCLNPDDFNDTIGRQVAREKAFAPLWELEGYHRRANHHEAQARAPVAG